MTKSTFSFSLDPELVEWLSAKAQKSRRSRSQTLEILLHNARRDEKPANKALTAPDQAKLAPESGFRGSNFKKEAK